jgi:MerR family transcriptional regulator, light-induced transcriptional regulator
MSADDKPLNIGALATATGVPADTIRTWERRYGFPKSHRNDSGHRVYEIDAVEHVRLITTALELGYRPSHLQDRSIDELKELLNASGREPAGESVRQRVVGQNEGVEAWFNAACELDRSRFERLMRRDWANMDVLSFVANRVAPFLVRMGEAWAMGDACVYQEHFASECLRDFLSLQWRTLGEHTQGPLLVFSTPTGDPHILGLHGAALLAASRGYRILFLGSQTPVEDVESACKKAQGNAVVLSLAEGHMVGDPIAYVTELRDRLAPRPIVLGGAGAPQAIQGVLVLRSFEDYDVWLRDIEDPSLDLDNARAGGHFKH